jgi:hypothetical protein
MYNYGFGPSSSSVCGESRESVGRMEEKSSHGEGGGNCERLEAAGKGREGERRGESWDERGGEEGEWGKRRKNSTHSTTLHSP